METIEKYGENLFDEYENQLQHTINNYKNDYGEKIKLIKIRHSPSIKLSNNGIDYSVEVNRWHVYNDLEIVGKIFSMFDKFGDYYYFRIYN